MQNEGYDKQTEDIFQITGDMDAGISSTVNLTKTALGHPKIRYENKHGQKFVMTCDVYQMGDELMVHIICPKCKNNLAIKSSRKQISYDAREDKLNFVEAFTCSWELTDELLGQSRDFGMSLCRWSAVIDDNLARDA